MITFDQAIEIILKNVVPLSYQEIAFSQASSEILFEDIYAKDDLPHFSSSAMDGYALIAKEAKTAPVTLKITGALKARETANLKIEKGLEIYPGDFAENITTQGINFSKISIGDKIFAGDNVILEVTQIGKKCHTGCEIQKITA